MQVQMGWGQGKKKDLHSISMDQSFVGYHKFQNHMDSSIPDQNFPSFRYDVAWKQIIVVRHNKSKSKWKTDTCGLENIKHD